MKLGIFAKTFSGPSPLEVLQAAAASGYACVQYNMACSGMSPLPPHIEPAVADSVRHASLKTGVDIAAVSATYNMIHPDIATRKAGRQSFEAIASAAGRIGTKLLTVCTGSLDAEDQWRHHPDNQGDAAWREMTNEFQILVEIADRYDILIGVEPELANVVNSAQRARALIDSIGSDRIRIVFDPANLFEEATPEEQRAIIAEAACLLRDRIEIAHAKDRNADGSFATAGKGVIDYRHYVAALRSIGFHGELVAHGLSAEEAPGVAAFLQDVIGVAAPCT
jgi:sugar phosphate isomerase/epimerase